MFNWRRVRIIAQREWRARVRERSFRIATGATLLIVLIAASVPTIISYFSDDSVDSTSIAVIDEAGISAADQLAPYVSSGPEDSDPITLSIADFPADQAASAVERGDVDAVLIVSRGADNQLAFTYINDGATFDSATQLVYAAVAAMNLSDRLQQAGVSEAQMQQAIGEPNFTLGSGADIQTDEEAALDGTKLAIGYVLTIVMFIAIQLYGTWIAQGVVEEKSSRLMEIMINAATPRDLLAGKVIGIGAAALTQLVPLLLAGGVAFALQPHIGDALGIETNSMFASIDFGALSFRAAASFMIYFVFGFILYASLYAGVASMLSRQEDLNQAIGPLMVVMMIGYISAFFTMVVPDSTFSQVLSIFPLTSPFNMAPRLVITDVPTWELALSIVLLVSAAAGGVMLAARIYRVGVLLYGQKPSLRMIFTRKNLVSTAR